VAERRRDAAFIGTAEFAAGLGIGLPATYDMLNANRIEGAFRLKKGGAWRIPRATFTKMGGVTVTSDSTNPAAPADPEPTGVISGALVEMPDYEWRRILAAA
jgi:hypothetical protein